MTIRMTLAALGLMAGASPTAATAVLTNSTNGGFEVPPSSWQQTAQGGTLRHAVNLGSQSLSASSFASFGRLTVSTTAFSSDPGPYTGGSGIDRRTANANALFQDNLTIFAGAPGRAASAVFAVRISELGNVIIGNSTGAGGSSFDTVTIGVSGAASPGLRLTTTMHSVARFLDAQRHVVTGIQLARNNPPSPTVLTAHAAQYAFEDTYLINVNFISGTPFTLVGSVACGSAAPTDNLAPFASGDCRVSQQWTGLRSVLDGQGHQIAATTTSASSFNYGSFTPGVPEPRSWALLIAGFGLTGSALRRRRTLAMPRRSRSRG